MPRRNARKRQTAQPIATLIAPPPEQIARGYTAGFVMDDDGRQALAYRNIESDAVARWQARGVLDQRQVSAIDIYRRAHWLAFGKVGPAMMNWSAASHIRGTLTTEDYIQNGLDAKKDIKRFDTKIFARVPRSYFYLWQNVVIHNQNIGTVGADIGIAVRNESQIAAKVVVRLICDMIAIEWGL